MPSTPVPPSPTPTPAPRTVEIWTTRDDSPWLQALRQAAEPFHADHPNVTVDVSGGHVDFGQIVEDFGTGQAPDVLEPGDLVPLAARSMLRSLADRLVGSKIDPSNYVSAMWANGSWNGSTYGIPALDHGPELGLAWNTSLTATATAPTSWADLYLFGRQLTRRDANGTIQTLGFDPLDGVGGILDTVRDVTGQEWFDPPSKRVSLDSPAYQTYLEGVVEFYNAVGIDPLSAFRKSYRPLTNTEQSAVDLGRQVAIVNGYWSVAEIARFARDPSWQFDYAWVPSSPAGAHVQRIGGRVLGIPSVANAPDDSWALIEILSGDATNRLFCDAVGTCAMSQSFLATGGWSGRPGMQFYVDSIGQATRLTSRSSNVVTGFAETKWVQAIGEVLSGKESAPNVLKAAQAEIQAEVNRVHE